MRATWKRKTVLYLLVFLVSLVFSDEAWGEGRRQTVRPWRPQIGSPYSDFWINHSDASFRFNPPTIREGWERLQYRGVDDRGFGIWDSTDYYNSRPHQDRYSDERFRIIPPNQRRHGEDPVQSWPDNVNPLPYRMGDDTLPQPLFLPGSPFQPPGQSGDPPAPGPRLQLPTFGQPAPQTLPGWPGGGAPQAIFPGGNPGNQQPSGLFRPLPAPTFGNYPGRIDCRSYPYLSAVGARNLALAPLAVTAIGVTLMAGGYVMVEGATVLYTVTETTAVTVSQAVVPVIQGAGRWALTTLSPGQATWRWLAATSVAAGCDTANRPPTTAPITTPLGFPLPGAVRPDRVQLYLGPPPPLIKASPFSK